MNKPQNMAVIARGSPVPSVESTFVSEQRSAKSGAAEAICRILACVIVTLCVFGLSVCTVAAQVASEPEPTLSDELAAWSDTLAECMAADDPGRVLESYSYQEQLDLLSRAASALTADEIVRGEG